MKSVKNDDNDILAFLDVVAADKTEKQYPIFKLARKLKSPYANMDLMIPSFK